MDDIEKQKLKLQQKKVRLNMEEVKFKIKERKMQTRRLIELGGLITKAELDNLPTNTLLGALLSLKDELAKHSAMQAKWTKIGQDALDQDQQNKSGIILKFETTPLEQVRKHIRQHDLKWNKLRNEWYGYVADISTLKSGLGDTQYQIEIVK